MTIKPPGRHYPGCVIQGDSLANLCHMAKCITKFVTNSAIADEDFFESVEELNNSLVGRLLHYQEVLSKHEIDFPHVHPLDKNDLVKHSVLFFQFDISGDSHARTGSEGVDHRTTAGNPSESDSQSDHFARVGLALPDNQQKKRKRGGQKGHPKHEHTLIPTGDCTEMIACIPGECACCGGKLSGVDPEPNQHQVWDVPEVKPQVTEYQQHTLTCSHCGILFPLWTTD